MILLIIGIFIWLFLNRKDILNPINLFLLSWSLYIGIKYLFQYANGRYYYDNTLDAIICATASFLFGYIIINFLFKRNKKIGAHYLYKEKNIGFKLLFSAILLVGSFTCYLFLLGVNIGQILTDPLAVRWILGNGGNNLFTQLFLVPLSVIPVIAFWNINKIKKPVLYVILLFCFFYFSILGIRGVIIDWFFSYIAIRSFKSGSYGLEFNKILKFVFFAFVVMTTIGIIRFNSQTESKVDLTEIDKSESLNLVTDLFFERLDFLDVLNAYLYKYENGNRELKIPIIPFISNFMPRNFSAEKLYPTDTQVTHIAGAGYDQENITRIVGPIPELVTIGGKMAIIIWFFLSGALFSLLSLKIILSKTGSLLQRLYSKQLLQVGSLPLFMGINTIFGTQFIIVTAISLVTFYILE